MLNGPDSSFHSLATLACLVTGLSQSEHSEVQTFREEFYQVLANSGAGVLSYLLASYKLDYQCTSFHSSRVCLRGGGGARYNYSMSTTNF